MRETSHVLTLQTTEVEVIATTLLFIVISVSARRRTKPAHVPLRSRLAFAALLFVQNGRITLVDRDFNRVLNVEVVILARHPLVVAPRVEIRRHTVLFLRKGVIAWRWTKMAGRFHRHLAQ